MSQNDARLCAHLFTEGQQLLGLGGGQALAVAVLGGLQGTGQQLLLALHVLEG